MFKIDSFPDGARIEAILETTIPYSRDDVKTVNKHGHIGLHQSTESLIRAE